MDKEIAYVDKGGAYVDKGIAYVDKGIAYVGKPVSYVDFGAFRSVWTAFCGRCDALGSPRGNTWPRGRSSRSVLERLDGILKRGGPLGSPRRNIWLRGRASRSVLKRFEAFGLHFRSWRSRDRRSHQGPAAQHIESRGPAPAGPCGAPAGAGALRFADRRPWV